MKNPLTQEQMAKRIAREFWDGSFINLGIGMPTLASNYIPAGRTVTLQSENGLIGYGPFAKKGQEDPELVNAGGEFVTLLPGASVVNMADSFDMIRGGHIDISVMGALEVSEEGDLANWFIPSRGVGRIGGAMDVAVGVKKLFIAMTHTIKGAPKILKKCKCPLTAVKAVHTIFTDLAVIEVTPKGLLLKEVAPGFTPADVQALTEPKMIVAGDLKEIEL